MQVHLLIQSSEDLKSKNWGFLESKEFCLETVTRKSWDSSLLAYTT